AGRMGRFEDAIEIAQLTGMPADIAAVRHYRSRGGVQLAVEQQVMPNPGVFVRAGVANGQVEPYEFKDADRTVAVRGQLSGTRWGRDSDTLGVAAGIVNNISSVHQAFLNAGGLGILVGDGNPRKVFGNQRMRGRLADKDEMGTGGQHRLAQPAQTE